MTECRYYGRDFTTEEMTLLRALIADPPALNRYALSKEFYRCIGWFRPDGGLKDMMARVTMLAMHKDGLITLPPPMRPRHPARDSSYLRRRLYPDSSAHDLLQAQSRPRRRRRPPWSPTSTTCRAPPCTRVVGTAIQAQEGVGGSRSRATVTRSLCAPGAGSRGCDGTLLPALARSRPGPSRSPGCSDTAPSRPRSPRASSRRGSARAGA